MEKLERQINDLFIKYAQLDFLDKPELLDQKLMGRKIKMSPRTLTYIYMQIKYNICNDINKDRVIKGEFDTFDHVCDVVRQSLEANRGQ